jgi:hypothetical protein
MEHPVLARAIEKFAAAGEEAGFTVEEMIQILNAGVGVKTLLDIIEDVLQGPGVRCGSSRWIMSPRH